MRAPPDDILNLASALAASGRRSSDSAILVFTGNGELNSAVMVTEAAFGDIGARDHHPHRRIGFVVDDRGDHAPADGHMSGRQFADLEGDRLIDLAEHIIERRHCR